MSPRPAAPGGSTVLEPKTKQKTQQPPLYKVLLHNDHYTPMEFVVGILMDVFHKSEGDAIQVMLHAHHSGFAVAGVFAKEIAETKVEKVTQLAQKAQYPLLCTMEEA